MQGVKMGDVIPNTRFPKPKTPKQREAARRSFARRPLSRRRREDVQLPPAGSWKR
jgi:hypothetical protein